MDAPQQAPGEQQHANENEEMEEVPEGPPRRPIPLWMKLTEQESDWAWDFYQEVQHEDSQLRPLSDMECAIQALVAKGNLEEAVQRARGLQYFRDIYNVQDTVEEGMAILEEFIHLQPGFFLYVDVIGAGGSVVALDLGAFSPAKAIESEENFRVSVLFFYYLSRIHQPTLQCIRAGVSYLTEGNTGWENQDRTWDQRFYDEYLMHDPIRFKQILVYNTSSIAHIGFSLCKPFLPREFKRVLKLGCQIGFDVNPYSDKLTLKDCYLQPTYEGAMQSLLKRARSLLELRYHHEETYELENYDL